MSVAKERDRSPLPPSPEDWLLDDKDLAKLEQFIDDEVEIVSDVDIPYTAGYSTDGKTIYMDREVPEFLELRSRDSRLKKVKFNIWKSFAVHEMTEKSLESMPYFWDYSISHEDALRMERLYVESSGVDWNDYNDKTLELVAKIMDRKTYPDIPKDLDLQPYKDSGDTSILKRMGIEE